MFLYFRVLLLHVLSLLYSLSLCFKKYIKLVLIIQHFFISVVSKSETNAPVVKDKKKVNQKVSN